MIRRLTDFNMYVAIAGFREAKISDVNRFFRSPLKEISNATTVQFFDAQFIATWQHLYFAALNALTAFANKTNISKSLAVETLLFASAQRQIRKATSMMGITPKTSEVAVLIIGENKKTILNTLKNIQKILSAKRDDGVLEIHPEKITKIKQFFNVSAEEFSAKLEKKGFENCALVDLVIEHVALLAIQR
ncbi:MAG: KEOPS complex subunit Cgi121 [Candidatus Bathyarchaeales archaeon]